MDKKAKNNRRQFLKNSSLAALGIGLISKLNAKEENSNQEKLSCDRTTLDYYGEGPFYTENPPEITDNQLANPDEPGKRMIISGRVLNLDCEQVIPNARIDIWHANDAGEYDNNSYNLRGYTYSNSQGFYNFETVKPGNYPNGGSFRPSHIHLKITPPEKETLITQIYFEGDEYIETDAAASITEGDFDATQRIIPLTLNNDGVLEGIWDIIVEGNELATKSDIHLNKGIIYNVSPNPFSDRIEINYGVFRDAKVSLLVYDMQGRLIANLEERNLQSEKYTAIWKPDYNLPGGHYFIALKINDLQVHYQKIVKQ